MRKKGLSLILTTALLGGSMPVSVWAEFEITTSESQNFEVTEDGTQAVMLTKDGVESASSEEEDGYRWYTVRIDSDGVVTDEIMLKMDDVWYFSTDQIEHYTDYAFDEEDMCFRERAEVKNGGLSKAIAIDTAAHTAFVRAYLQKLDNIYEYNGQLYYPIHQILPLMECGCGVDGDVLYIENAEMSMVDALGTYIPEVLYYDAAEEFAGNKWANLIMVGTSYLFDTVGHADNWTRLLGAANYVDYKAAAKDYLTQYEIYEEVMIYKNELTDTAKEGKQAKQELESLMKEYKFLEMIHNMLEVVGNESDFYHFIPEDVWNEISGWAKVADISGKALEAVTDYVLMVKDHRDMLAAVYPKIEKDVSFTDQKYKGIKSVYDAYGGSMLHAILTETSDGLKEEGVWYVVEKGVEKLVGVDLGLYKLVADVGGWIMTEFVEQLGIKASDDMALLNHHIILTNEAKEKYINLLQSGAYTQEKVEDLRLAALMTMISSKRCFEIIRDNNALNEEISAYCNNRIAQIDEVLKKIYLAKNAVMVDGIEYYKEAPEMFELQLMNLRVKESNPPKPLSELEQYFRDNYSKNDNMWLLDVVGNDGIKELLVVTAPDENNITYFRIYTTYDAEVSMIFEEWAGTVPGERKAMYLMEDGYGNYAFFYYYPRILEGYDAIIDVFALETYGGYIYLRSESVKWESELPNVMNDVIMQFYQLNPYWMELFSTVIGSEEECMKDALDYMEIMFDGANGELNEPMTFTEEDDLTGTPAEESEWNSGSGTKYQMPEDIFWMIEDAFGTFQMRFRNESDGCYIDLTAPDGFVYSTFCTLDAGAGSEIYIDDQWLLQQYVMSFSQDFTGGGYSITYDSQTQQIYVVTMNGQWIELYFFDH